MKRHNKDGKGESSIVSYIPQTAVGVNNINGANSLDVLYKKIKNKDEFENGPSSKDLINVKDFYKYIVQVDQFYFKC